MIHVGYETDTLVGAYTSLAHHCVVHGAPRSVRAA